jgi:tetratricopeptide (TPR) repeat protein
VDDVQAAKEIVNLVDGLPLAVRLAGSYLNQAKENAADYLKWLEVSLESLKHSERQHEIVPLLLKRSLAQVSEQARQALAVTGLLALLASFDREVVAAGLGFEPIQAESWLRELVNYGLLLRRDDRYKASHALIHEYARERGELPDEVVTRLAGYYDALTREQRELGPIGYARLDNDRAHMMAVLAACAEQELWEVARDLVWAVDDYLDIRGYRIEQVLTLEIGVKTAQELGNRGDEGAVLGKLGNAYRYLGQMDRAIESYQQTLAVYRKLGDRRGEGSSLGNLGLVYCELGQGDRAIEYHQQALIIQRKINDRHGESISLGNLGLAYSTLGQMQRAIEFYQLALVVQREIGDPSSKANRF